MSRIGQKPITIPSGVAVEVKENRVQVKGPKGELAKALPPGISAALEEGELVVRRGGDDRRRRALHGLTRAILANMVHGVSQGFRKELEIEGVGYRAEMQGKKLLLLLGFSHPVEIDPPSQITISLDRGAKLVVVEGVDKELVGEVAAKIRRSRPSEPYKGKGVHYLGERIKKKAGKAGKVGATSS